MSFLKKVTDMVEDTADLLSNALGKPDTVAPSGRPQPVQKTAYLITFNPRIPSEGNKGLIEVMGWKNPEELAAQYIADLREVSGGYANYSVVKRDVVDSFPAKVDGFVYDPDKFVVSWHSKGKDGGGFHTPDWTDYHKLVAQFNIIPQINEGKFDEVWFFGFPYGGFYESRMAGPGAFWCNAPALENTNHAKRRFVMMGFSYQRGVGEMLENMGHRAESIMKHVYRNHKGEENLWERFSRYDQTHPNRAEVGLMHFAPNSTKDYEWGRDQKVPSRAHTWRNFPNLAGEAKTLNREDWGGGDTRAHNKWWFEHLPQTSGRTDGVSNNWWEYIIDPDKVK